VKKKSAKKALVVSLKRKEANKKIKESFKKALKKKDLSLAYSLLDRAAVKKTIHKNKAARLKSRLAKKLNQSSAVTPKPKNKKPQTKR
jgi:small subunit ribosomal protein S20